MNRRPWPWRSRRPPVPPAVRIDRAGRVGAVALLAVAGLGWLWARSAAYADVFSLVGPGATVQAVASHRGVLTLVASSIPTPAGRAWTVDHDAARSERFDPMAAALERELAWQLGGGPFLVGRSGPDAFRVNGRSSFCLLRVPHWLPMLLALAPSARRMAWAARARRRLRRGRCFACGYDLRGTGGTCPECGTRAPARE